MCDCMCVCVCVHSHGLLSSVNAEKKGNARCDCTALVCKSIGRCVWDAARRHVPELLLALHLLWYFFP